MPKKALILTLAVLALVFNLFSVEEKDIISKYKLKKVENPQQGTVTYMPSGAGGRSTVFLYIVKVVNENSFHVRLRIARFAAELMHIRKYTFTAAEQDYVLEVREPVQSMDLNRQNTPGTYFDREGSGICEFYDIGLNPEEMEKVIQIAAADKVKLRLDGVKGFELAKVFSSDLKDMKRVLEAFKVLKGE